MISIYQVFRIVAGLMISGFILYFLVTYIVSYSSMQESIKATKIVGNFKKAAGSVYTSGNPMLFSDFSKTGFRFYTDVSGSPGIVSIEGNVPKLSLDVPLFFVQGDDILISRNHLDMGWWKFYYVTAIPEMKIYFNPLDNEPKTWELIESITEMFPESRGYGPKIAFGFCDGQALKSRLCGADNKGLCERGDFLDVLGALKRGDGAEFDSCEAEGSESSRVVTISYDCSDSDGFDVCITPPNSIGIGNVYSGGDVWVYKDPLDILVFIVGDVEVKDFENSGGDFFILKNSLQQREIGLAAEINKQRYKKVIDITSRLVSEGKLSASSDDARCLESMGKFSVDAEELIEIVSEDGYYLDLHRVQQYDKALETMEADWRGLVNAGCDYET